MEAASPRPRRLIVTSILYVECGPYYWVVSWGSNTVTIEKRRMRQEKEGAGDGGRVRELHSHSTIMQYCRKVYWMCLLINNQFIGT